GCGSPRVRVCRPPNPEDAPMRFPPAHFVVLAVFLGIGSHVGSADPAPAPTNVAATVNGEVIRLDEVDALIRRRPVVDGPLTAAQAHDLRLAVTNDLIDDLLLAQFLRQHGPAVEPAEIDQKLRAMAEGLRRQGRTLADFAREMNRTEAQFRAAWTAAVQFEKLIDAKATDDELRKYHAGYRDFFDRVSVKAAQIVIRVGPASPPGEWAAARQKLAAVRAEIAGGKRSFADAAQKFSVDPSASAGGDVGWIARKDTVVDEAFARAAFALKVGEISAPTDAAAGVCLIRVSERKAGTPAEFEKVREDVRDCYADDVRQNLLGHLRKTAIVQVSVP
ncbi:MAG: peptidylprolyl isomerase, partial [Fimbriiglobus sp.]